MAQGETIPLAFRIAPGLKLFRLSARMAAPRRDGRPVGCGVAIPVGVAYAQLAGFKPVVGLYASILPLGAYALFGTSPQLIVGPDAATCAMTEAPVLANRVTVLEQCPALGCGELRDEHRERREAQHHQQNQEHPDQQLQ